MKTALLLKDMYAYSKLVLQNWASYHVENIKKKVLQGKGLQVCKYYYCVYFCKKRYTSNYKDNIAVSMILRV